MPQCHDCGITGSVHEGDEGPPLTTSAGNLWCPECIAYRATSNRERVSQAIAAVSQWFPGREGYGRDHQGNQVTHGPVDWPPPRGLCQARLEELTQCPRAAWRAAWQWARNSGPVLTEQQIAVLDDWWPGLRVEANAIRLTRYRHRGRMTRTQIRRNRPPLSAA